jgi:hypothetical protein
MSRESRLVSETARKQVVWVMETSRCVTAHFV